MVIQKCVYLFIVNSNTLKLVIITVLLEFIIELAIVKSLFFCYPLTIKNLSVHYHRKQLNKHIFLLILRTIKVLRKGRLIFFTLKRYNFDCKWHWYSLVTVKFLVHFFVLSLAHCLFKL